MYKRILIFIVFLLLCNICYGQRVVGNPNVITIDLGGWGFANYLQVPGTLELKPGRDYCHTIAMVHDTLFTYSCALNQWIPVIGGGGLSTVYGGYGVTVLGGDTIIADTTVIAAKSWVNLNFVTLLHLNEVLADYITDEVDPVFVASPSYGISNGNITNWNTAYNKYVASVGFSDGILTLTKNDASTLTQSLDGRWQLFSDTSTYDVTLAHLHVILSGYLTTEVDPVFTASPAFGITNGNIANWNIAYNKYVTGIGFSGGTLTLSKNDATTLTQSFDGRYQLYSDTSSAWGLTLAHLNTIISGYASLSGSYANPSWITSLSYSKITGGTSGQFVKADGSLDNTVYITAASLIGYVPYTGATGNINIGSNSFYTAGSIGIGTTSPATPLEVWETVTVTPRGITNTQASNTANPAQFHLRKTRGVIGSLLSVISGDVIGRNIFDAYDGSSFVQAADIRAVIANTVTTTSVPSYLSFFTSSNAVPSVMAERMRINTDGSISYFGTTSGSYTFLTPAAITSYTLSPPSAVGLSGQVQNISSVSGNLVFMDWFTPVRTTIAQTWTKAQAGSYVDVAYTATVTPDFSLANMYRLQLTGNVVLGTPTNLTEGQTGVIDIYQDATGSRLLSSSSWAWCFQAGILPVLTTTAKTKDMLAYKVSQYRTSAAVTMNTSNPGTVTWTAHGLFSGMKIQFSNPTGGGGGFPAAVAANTTYYVLVTGANTFQIGTTFATSSGVNFSGGSPSNTYTGTVIAIDANITNDFR